MSGVANLVLSLSVGFWVLVLYAVLPPQLYFGLLGTGAVIAVLGQNKEEDSNGEK